MKITKNQIVILYGAMGVGKLTIGKMLAKKLNFKLSHNHLINDLVSSVFEKGKGHKLLEKIRYDFYKEISTAKENVIITHCYANDFISPTGLSDKKYLKDLELIFTKSGTRVAFIHLQAQNNVLLKRITANSRKKYGKLRSVPIMKKILATEDFTTSAPVKNNLAIDTSDKTVTQTVESIINYLKK